MVVWVSARILYLIARLANLDCTPHFFIVFTDLTLLLRYLLKQDLEGEL